MAGLSPIQKILYAGGAGIGAGAVFAFIIGDLNTAAYLIEQLSIGLIEAPFAVLSAVIARKSGWKAGFLYTLAGVVVCSAFMSDMWSITPLVFLKIGLSGIIIGEIGWFSGSFARRLTGAAVPGLLLTLVIGLPLVTNGVTPEVVNEIRQDALDMYMTFMPEDDAVNTADNAMAMFEGVFSAGMGVFAIASLVITWLSFLVAGWAMKRVGETAEYVPPVYTFKLPFHLMWVFLAAFGILLSEFGPVFPYALNVFTFLAFLYLVQGIAIVMFHMNRVALGLFPRILFWLVFFVTIGFIGFVLIFAGVVDNWFNLRSVPLDRKASG